MSIEGDEVQHFELSEEEVHQLIKSPFEKRTELTDKIAAYYQSGGFSEEQMVAAAKVFGILVKDAEVKIRKALFDEVQKQDNIAKDVMMAFAHDIQTIKLPVLQFSDVLTDEDLIEIVTSTEKNNNLQSELLLKDKTNNQEDNVEKTKENNSLLNVLDKIYDKDEILGSMIDRNNLPITVVSNLVKRVSDSLYSKLLEKHLDHFKLIDQNIIAKSCDVAILRIIGLRSKSEEYDRFTQIIKHLDISEELIPIYALCMGNLHIFQVIIARITQTPVQNIKTLIMDESNKGFRAMYLSSGLSKDLLEASEYILQAMREIYKEEGDLEKSGNIASKINYRINKHLSSVNEVKNLDYLLSIVNQYSS